MKRSLVLIISAFFIGAGGQVLSDEGTADGDFTFKRVKVPGAGVGKRITVQIDPSGRRFAAHPNYTTPSEDTPVDPPAAGAVPVLGWQWFWDEISPSLADSGAGSLDAALAHLSMAPAGEVVPVPRLADMQELAQLYGIEILTSTIGTEVSPALVLSVMAIESAGRSKAVSSAGATGLMQLMPATAARFGVTDSTIPAQNIKGGVAYLNWLMQEFDRDPVMVLAGYNAGENAVKKHEGVPPYAETRAYVPKVLAAWTIARGLCLTPPELVSDGCVFNVQKVATNDE